MFAIAIICVLLTVFPTAIAYNFETSGGYHYMDNARKLYSDFIHVFQLGIVKNSPSDGLISCLFWFSL